MHFEVLVEDRSSSVAVDTVLGKVLGENNTTHSWRVHPYRGLGRIPQGLTSTTDPRKRILLDRLPRLLKGYGRSLDQSLSAVVVVVDLDDRDCIAFKRELLDVLGNCDPSPRTLFRIAIEESEAWLLGDRAAVLAAYPQARRAILNRYVQDSICGTWELLADAVHAGGSKRLKELGWQQAGRVKHEWAERIAPHMDVEMNASPSFRAFRDGIRTLVATA